MNLGQALEDLKIKQCNYGIVNKEYETIAYHEMKAAEERVNIIIKQMKRGGSHD